MTWSYQWVCLILTYVTDVIKQTDNLKGACEWCELPRIRKEIRHIGTFGMKGQLTWMSEDKKMAKRNIANSKEPLYCVHVTLTLPETNINTMIVGTTLSLYFCDVIILRYVGLLMISLN